MIAYRCRSMKALLGPLCVLAILLGVVPQADAQTSREHGVEAKSPEHASRDGSGRLVLHREGSGPLELTTDGLDFVGGFVVENVGDRPVRLEQIAVRTSTEDPRTPPGLSAELERGSPGMVMKPGEKRTVRVRWRTSVARARELYGHVLVVPADEAPGRPENHATSGVEHAEDPHALPAAMGIHAHRGRGLGWVGAHALSLLMFIPLLGALGAGLLRRTGDALLGRVFPVAAHGLNLLLSVWIYAVFDTGFARSDGNDGLQFVERRALLPSLGAEYSVGVDGLSVPLVVLATVVGVVTSLLRWGRDPVLPQRGEPVLLDVAVAAMIGMFVAQDLLLLSVSWVVLLASLGAHLLGGKSSGQQPGTHRFLAFAAVSVVLLVLSTGWLLQHAGPSYLVDGGVAARTAALPELARVDWVSEGLTLAGVNALKLVWIALLIAFGLFLPIAPLHGWLPTTQTEAPAPARVVIASGLLAAAGYGVLRMHVGVLPDATRWAAAGMSALGVLTLISGAVLALGQRDLVRLLGYVSVSRAGLVLLGAGTLTPQGIQGAAAQLVLHGLVAALLFAVASWGEARSRTRELDGLGGRFATMPRATWLLGLALLASLGVPGSSGFWGSALVLFGAASRYPWLAAVVTIGLLLGAAAHVRALCRVLPGGGHERAGDLGKLELGAVLPVALLVLLLGLFPRLLLGVIDRTTLDLHRRLDPASPTQIALESRDGEAPAWLGGRDETSGELTHG
ncbi:complex I subunit 4 family protein [Chondromyces crocatus]|uniref:NADH:quinone oxidoreductase/Mrp antiporter transmembrane domain-containing protein n=1 Tax=Chondromyces crocatus TaxID=52 RepID=A0A0K1E7G5_CHOCO|nr:NADH-quinone oxidoreductase subunit M [Chondromyces crocatus]AKT36805.1 uncharacterized protein CMC5_009260 [Chondromyces crocatus]